MTQSTESTQPTQTTQQPQQSQSQSNQNNGSDDRELPSINMKQKCCTENYANEDENEELKRLKRECVNSEVGTRRDKILNKDDYECVMACILREKNIVSTQKKKKN